jgi:hypothetical protein
MQQVVIVPTELKLQRNTTGAYLTINIEVFIEVVVVLPVPHGLQPGKSQRRLGPCVEEPSPLLGLYPFIIFPVHNPNKL